MHRLNPPNASPARFSATTVIACVALVLSGCAVGILLGRWTASPSTVTERTVEAASAESDIQPALANLQRTADAILQTIRAGGNAPRSGSSERESAAQLSDNPDRLTAAIETLNALLQSNGGHLGGRSAAVERWKGPGYASLNSMWTRVHEIARGNDPDWGEKFDSEMRQAHLAWTREDLFERYGAPTILNAKDRGLELGYERKLEEDAIESIVFLVADDLVVYIYYSH
jgi:hypothetical protein